MRRSRAKSAIFWTAIVLALLLLAVAGLILRAGSVVVSAARRPLARAA